MSRRRKSATSDKKSKDGATGSDEWSQEEKTRLLDALKEDDGENNWRWIARKVNTKTMAQVKQFAEKLNRVKRAVNKRSTPPSNKRPIAPKDNESLEEWINATKRLRGDDDVDGTCIPQIMTIAAMEPVLSEPGSLSPDYSQIYTLLSRVMREQSPPNLTPLDASVILDLLNDLERRLAGHDINSQVNFVVDKYREIMATTHEEATTSTGRVLPPRQAKASQGSSDTNSGPSRPKTQLFSLNPLNVPVELLNLKKRTPVNPGTRPPPEGAKEQNRPTAPQQSTAQ